MQRASEEQPPPATPARPLDEKRSDRQRGERRTRPAALKPTQEGQNTPTHPPPAARAPKTAEAKGDHLQPDADGAIEPHRPHHDLRERPDDRHVVHVPAPTKEAWMRTLVNDEGEKEIEVVIDGKITMRDEKWILGRILAGFQKDHYKIQAYKETAQEFDWNAKRLLGLRAHMLEESPYYDVAYGRVSVQLCSADWLCALLATDQPLKAEHLAVSFMFLGDSDIDSDTNTRHNGCFTDPKVQTLSEPMRVLLAACRQCIQRDRALRIQFTRATDEPFVEDQAAAAEGGFETANGYVLASREYSDDSDQDDDEGFSDGSDGYSTSEGSDEEEDGEGEDEGAASNNTDACRNESGAGEGDGGLGG